MTEQAANTVEPVAEESRKIRANTSHFVPAIVGGIDTVEARMDYNFAEILDDRQDIPRGSGEAISSALTRKKRAAVRMTRHGVRMNGLAARVPDVSAAYGIGTGIRPSIPDDDEDLMRLWGKWTKVAGAEKAGSFYNCQETAWREWMIGGDQFTYLRFRKGKKGQDLPVPFQLQIMGTEMVPTYVSFNTKARGGIVRTADGDPSAYYVYKNHPGERFDLLSPEKSDLLRVPAHSILHLFHGKEAGTIRGEPWLTRVLIEIHDLKKYMQADLTRKILTANIAYWLEMPALSEEEKERLADVYYDVDNKRYVNSAGEEVEAPKSQVVAAPENGTVATLPAGAKVNVTAPAESGNTFSPFMQQIMLQIALAVNIPVVYLFGDPTNLNDRLYKGISQQFERQVNMWRQTFNAKFNNPIWNTFVRLAVSEGRWKVPAGKKLEDFLNPEWVGQPFPQLHYAQEISAWTEAVEEGFETHSDIVRKKGDDPDRVRRERLDDLVKDIRAGLKEIPAFWGQRMIQKNLGWGEKEVAEYRAQTGA